MSQTAIEHLVGMRIAGVETGAQFAERASAQVATGCGPISVVSPLAPLLPAAGLERGYVYGCTGDAATSLLFALVASATSTGSWLAMVNMARAGLMSAHEHGVALHRTLCVSAENTSTTMSQVLGALVDGLDVVAVSSPVCSVSDARRVVARAKAQGAVLFVLGDPGGFSIDASFSARTEQWQFDTHAHSRTVNVSASGRRVYAHRSCSIQLPIGSCS